MKQKTSPPCLMKLNLPDDESALAAAKRLALDLGKEIVVTDSEGREIGTAKPALDN